ncbi:MAG: hypothetical protein IT285_15340 [Bdellovibrionales bacterium]|nr:hypothetical protein [Bdellovibrionales bacterium]
MFFNYRLWVVFALPVLSGCGNALNCEIYGDNVEGRIYFTRDVEVDRGKNIVVEYSENAFTSVTKTSPLDNQQGLLSIPYSLCAESEVDFAIRAYQDENGNGVYDAGEGNGRHDLGPGSHTAYREHQLGPAEENAEDSNDVWPTKSAVDVWLDETGAQ